MRNFIFLLLFILPVIVVSQDDSLSFKCSDLIKEHMNSCERCKNGDKCHTRRDLLEFCSGKDEQELIVVDPGPESCGCPVYGYPTTYHTNYYTPYQGGYHYTGPTFSWGVGVNLSIGGGRYRNSRGYHTYKGNYYGNANSHHHGGHHGNGGYHGNGNHHQGGGYHGNGNHNQSGGYHQSGHYGSRPHSRRGG